MNSTGTRRPPHNKTPIRHVVVLMLENRSYDQIFHDHIPPNSAGQYNTHDSVGEDDISTRLWNMDKNGDIIYQNPIKIFSSTDGTAP